MYMQTCVYTYTHTHTYPVRKQAHARYKKWTADTRQKQIAGFTASLRARTGDDSFDQE